MLPLDKVSLAGLSLAALDEKTPGKKSKVAGPLCFSTLDRTILKAGV